MSSNWKPLPILGFALFSSQVFAESEAQKELVGVDSHLVPLLKELVVDLEEPPEIQALNNIPGAMINREIRVGISSRKWTDFEVAQFELETGYRPTELYFTADVVAFLANVDNPNNALPIDVIRSVFGCQETLTPVRWAEWGSEDSPVLQPFAVDGGLKFHKKFTEWTTCKEGTYVSTQFVVDEKALISKLDGEKASVAYVTYVDRFDQYKLLSVTDDRGVTYDLNKETILSGRYPLSSVYYMYLDYPPHRDYLTDDEKKFIGLALDTSIKETLNDFGFISLPEEAIRRNKVRLGLEKPIVEGGYK
ncbi:PstS family phosphate ABC transporter substrate-binding protein [Vibrio sp. TBV020]|uniref:PstS family phosphate ABC transporter substrate-binding protein n=1 Tax=Vibrio sp. TBV020 TaxID=3137398 RepID=UPI0038CD27D8